MNKKVYYIVLSLVFLTIIIITQVKAANSCDDSQTIIYLSSVTNAHGASSSTSGYNKQVCYDEIFGTTYTGANPHQCSALGNKVIRLSASTNAHAEQTNYATAGYQDICYGNLLCTSRSLQNCQNNEEEVLRLYNPTNSHLALGGSGIGAISICCRIRGNITGAHWENLAGEEIVSSNVGSTVAMVVPGEEIAQQNINYTVEKKSTSWLLFTTWTGVSSVKSGGTGLQIVLTQEGTFRFRARIEGQSNEQISEELEVSGEEINNPPVIKINAPIDGGIYLLDQTLAFRADVIDSDDTSVSMVWDFGDGQTSNSKTPDYRYIKPGQKTITLRATDTRGAVTEERAQILLVNSSYFLAYISTPKYNEQISGLGAILDATSKSYAVEVTHGATITIKCIAGNCPSTTADGSISVQNTPAGIDSINFSWILSDGYKRSGYGISNGRVEYQFSSPGLKSATMNVSLAPGLSSMTWTNFTVYLPNSVPYCSIQGGQSSWITNQGSTSSLNDCYNSNSANGNYCCPSGYSCTQQSGSSQYKCVPGGASICSDYTTKTACEGYSSAVAEESVSEASNGVLACGEVTNNYEEDGKFYREIIDNCKCVWNTGNGGQCQSAYDTIKECVDGSCGEQTIGSCTTEIALSEDLCSTSQRIKIYNINSQWTGSGEAPQTCKSTTIEVGCVDFSQVKLPFYDYWQLIITLLIISGIYLLRERKKK